MSNAGSSALWFLLIIAMIPLALWLLKRSPLAHTQALNAQQPTRIVSTMALGQHQRVVTIEVGQGEARQWLVLGVTAHQINTLHTLPAQELPPPVSQKAAATFASLLQRTRKN